MPEHLSSLWAKRACALNAPERQLARRMQPILTALEALPDQERLVIALDGPCGSGKTTLAGVLTRLTDAACVHMDDFHLPHGLKTPERLAQPGGNSDRTRFLQEVLLPWKRGEAVAYRPYDCARDELSAPVQLPPKRILIVEGSYSHHPELSSSTDLQVFLQIDREEQLHRLVQRDPAKLPMFTARWIPLEDAYFTAFHLPAPGAVVIHNGSVQGM